VSICLGRLTRSTAIIQLLLLLPLKKSMYSTENQVLFVHIITMHYSFFFFFFFFFFFPIYLFQSQGVFYNAKGRRNVFAYIVSIVCSGALQCDTVFLSEFKLLIGVNDSWNLLEEIRQKSPNNGEHEESNRTDGCVWNFN
jgi:hypothetical protein